MDRIYAPWRSRYFTMEKGEGCLFCRIQKEENDSTVGILYRGKHWFVILNMFPYTNGHIMVVANRHLESIREIDAAEGQELIALLARCERALDEAYHPHALNTGTNRGEAAGAGVVGHLHFHLVPRWNGDTNFMTALADIRVISEDIEKSFKRLSPYFQE
ncbi:MAG: HIT domain-containing protein [Candidatus Krumholzibacteriota bacterium]|nr:HIT domain-containing protein [Candidatus Krumholzibacteriota bacterium]